jgi:SAM-dependent methyltransferase
VVVDRARARAFAANALASGEPLRWFEELYAAASAGEAEVPWADLRANPNLVTWPLLDQQRPKSALIVGCGLGDDAEWLAARGIAVTAFDIAPTAVSVCCRRFPGSSVNYIVADLLNLPTGWVEERFDLVVEAYTVQVLPPGSPERAASFGALASVTGGTLLAIARGRGPADDPGSMPWPLTIEEMESFEEFGLTKIALEDYPDPEEPTVRRFRATYRRETTRGTG